MVPFRANVWTAVNPLLTEEEILGVCSGLGILEMSAFSVYQAGEDRDGRDGDDGIDVAFVADPSSLPLISGEFLC